MNTAEPTLNDVKRQATIDHILTAARKFALQNGIDSSMDRLSEAAGVSRRTLFRLFGTREELLAAALKAGMLGYKQEIPAYAGNREHWLRETCAVVHRMNALPGIGFWELALREDLPADIASTEKSRRRSFRKMCLEVATTLWQAHTHEPSPPAELVSVVGAHCSPFYTAAVTTDMGKNWPLASELAYEAITCALHRLSKNINNP